MALVQGPLNGLLKVRDIYFITKILLTLVFVYFIANLKELQM